MRVVKVAVGDEVDHESFGRGTVSSVSGSGESAKATVDFDEAGRKRLLLRYAPLRKL
ncbi:MULTISPECIES: hypothetical protein [Streptomyces]|uniref:DNA helicase-2/ATP-dependent DNA helicase PcrA n=1 Tax=Streptomyces clavifer TaxID=68188 RepID=A0ABS4VA83_9ACTN|nr:MULTISPECIES: hypothetical protein [Streptomyces]MBP2360752.1 DNA helicase-2/ATP-dependent DNA helicase PcrA [Streptomyces clavifer]MDX2746073.1 hypothetical protein [Streptomyces sp. NRRL_B-2557]MDX3064185.1 hypothetical protein [Streptomyces sp. ND04-05B]WUC32317.1 hypothetical protein OG927_14175 [Streptomyces clavifer]GHB11861.1 hypothetical protein GCM10010392_44340 [Streptomyces clavifer]